MDEKEWVARLVQGDEAAFCELYAAYKNRLIYFAFKLLKSPDFAEDLFQDTFASIWKNRLFIDAGAPFGPYVYTIMRNRIVNLLTQLERHEQLASSLRSTGFDDLPADGFTPLDRLETDDLFQLLDRSVAQLPPRQEQVFRLSREQGLSHREIAGQLSLSVHTVQEYISDALKTLRSVLARDAGIHAEILLVLWLMEQAYR